MARITMRTTLSVSLGSEVPTVPALAVCPDECNYSSKLLPLILSPCRRRHRVSGKSLRFMHMSEFTVAFLVVIVKSFITTMEE